jgi:hypothetical protein
MSGGAVIAIASMYAFIGYLATLKGGALYGWIPAGALAVVLCVYGIFAAGKRAGTPSEDT